LATRKQQFKVGLFLVICFGIMAIGAVYLSGLYEEEGLAYWVIFDESVLGVYEGGLVEYLGVGVGKVNNIEVTRANQVRVDIMINPDKVQLCQGVQAQLVMYSLAAGTMAISLSGGEGGEPLPPNTQIPTKPSVLSSVSSSIDQVMADVAQVVAQVKAGLEGLEEGDLNLVVDRVNALLEEGEGFLEDGRGFVHETTEAVKQVRGRADGVIEEVEGLASELRTTARDVDKLVVAATEKLGELEVTETQSELNRTLTNLADVSAKINDAMAQFDNLSANLMHETDNVENSLRGAVREIAEALDAVRQFVNQAKQDPASFLRGPASIEGSRE